MEGKRSVLWQGLNWPGSEYCCLAALETGWLLAGTAVVAAEGQPVRGTYRIECERDWRTRRVEVRVDLGPIEHNLTLSIDEQQRWQLNGQDVAALAGCIDVDLGFSPSTNSLPIRRLKLAVGESAEVAAAWLRFPSLELRRLDQRYTRLAERRYRYESEGGFMAELEVDKAGLVVDYPGGWRRVAGV